MAELSPAAQSVLDATDYPEDWATRIRVAAALRAAAAEQVAPSTPEPKGAKPTAAWHRWNVTGALRLNLLSIADELENQ